MVRGLLAEREDALLPALAAHVQGLAVEVDICEIESDGLGASQAGRVHQLEECTIAERERGVALDDLEKCLDLGGLRHVRQPAGSARSE